MSEAPRLLDYQREISKATRQPLRRVEPEEETPWTDEADALEAAGWEYKLRQGLRIWCRDPDDLCSFWKSEEMAYETITKGEK